MTSSSQQGSLSDLSLFSSPSMPNISLGRPHVPSGSSTVSVLAADGSYNVIVDRSLKDNAWLVFACLFADRYEIGHRLGGRGTRGVHRATRDAAHRTNVAWHLAFLSIVDGDRRRRRHVERRLRSQTDAEYGTPVDNEPATPVCGLRHRDRHGSHHRHASSACEAAKGWSPAFR